MDARSCKNNADRMIRRFLKKTKKTRIVEEFRDRQYYKKPSAVLREKKNLAKLRKKYRKDD